MIKDFKKTAIVYKEQRISYKELLQRISLFSEVTPFCDKAERLSPAEKRTKIVILSENRPGFIYSFFSIWNNYGIVVPVDAMASISELSYILSDCQPSAIWTSSNKQDVARAAIKETGLEIPILSIDYFESIEINETPLSREIEYKDEQTALIIYTSGTTGSPKGVMLSFKNLLTNIKSVSEEVPIYTTNRRALILLPLHHVLPLQGTMIAPIILGAGVAISPSMAAPDIMKTLQDGEVGLFIGVPRLWQSLYDGIMKKINASYFTRALYAICEKIDNPKFSKIVFNKIHKMMGGHLEACPSGGAALDPKIWKGLHTLGIEIIEGYGMTECAPIITFSRPGDLRPGCVGQALPSCQMTIKDGEICAKGDNIMQGYYNNTEETALAIDEDGWLHSGDLGYTDEDGRLYITGRKKELIVLSNGKNINPTEVESELESHSDCVKEAAVIEENHKLKAILCPQPHWAKDKSLSDIEKIIKQEVIDLYNKTAASYKKISGIYVHLGELPRTRMEKIQRYKLYEIINSCRLETKGNKEAINKYEKTSEEYNLLATHIKKEKKIEVHPSDNLITDLEMDSLDIVDLECMIEQSFGIKVSQEQISAIGTLSLLADYISVHRKKLEHSDFNLQKELMMDSSKCVRPHMAISGWWITRITRWIMNRYFSTQFYGLYNIPQEQQFILVSNHQSYLDSLFIVQGFHKNQLNNTCFFAKEEHVNTPLRRFLARHHSVLVLKKNDMKNSILDIGRALKMGSNLIIFPEGTRTETGDINEFRPTFAMLSITLGIPVLPVCIQGAFEALPKHCVLPRRKHVSVCFLPPIFPKLEDTEESLVSKVHYRIESCLHNEGAKLLVENPRINTN